MRESSLQDQVHEASKPLARFKDDKDLDEMLRREERLEDPMLDFIRKKKEKEDKKSGKKKKKGKHCIIYFFFFTVVSVA